MLENQLKKLFKDKQTIVNAWLHIPSTWSAEVMAQLPFDSLTVDLQHGMAGLETAIQMIQIISRSGKVAMARATWNDPGLIMRLLDAGAYGIICPMINTRAEAEAFVGACRYLPQGYRSLGPTRAKLLAGADYAQHANEEILTFAMIESKEAIDNLSEIASVPGLDGLYVGPGDLRLSLLGAGGIDNHDPAFLTAIDHIISAAQEHELIAGIHCNSSEYANFIIERGMNMVTLKTDTVLLREAAGQIIDGVRGAASQQTATDAY